MLAIVGFHHLISFTVNAVRGSPEPWTVHNLGVRHRGS